MHPNDDSLQLLPDVPPSYSRAKFNFPQNADALAKAILASPPRLTVAVFGAWGTGKTTLLELVKERLSAREPRLVVVPFEPWRHQQGPHVALSMTEAIQHALRSRRISKPARRRLGSLARAIAAGTTVKAGIWGTGVELNFKSMFGSREHRRSDYFEWKGILKEALDQLPLKRVVILIDDLDRCLPGKAVEALEAMKVFFDVEGVVFVLALDKEVMFKAVEAHYPKEYGISGKDYMKKLIQVEFELPSLQYNDLEAYIDTLKEQTRSIDGGMAKALKATIHLVSSVRSNPREVKRFINSALIVRGASSETAAGISADVFVAFMGMKWSWPQLVERLAADNKLLGILHEYVDAQAPDLLASETQATVSSLMVEYPGLEDFLSVKGKKSPILNLSGGDIQKLWNQSRTMPDSGHTSDSTERANIVSAAQQRAKRMTLTSSTTAALLRARDIAFERNQYEVDVEYLLVGALQTSSGHPEVEAMLVKLGVDARELSQNVLAGIGRGRDASSKEPALSDLAGKAIEAADDEAQQGRRDMLTLGALLLGILKVLPEKRAATLPLLRLPDAYGIAQEVFSKATVQ